MLKKSLIALLAAATLAGCATDDPNQGRNIGVVTGAIIGGVVGKQVSGADGAPIVGAVAGAIAGGAVGGYRDRQRAELKRKLEAEERARQLSISEMPDGSLNVSVAADVTFDTGASALKPQAQAALDKFASTMTDFNATVVHVVGHTDSVGSDASNQSLSQRRAASVSSYLASRGIPVQRIREEGRGERELLVRTPDETNEPRNRRVDIVLKAIVQGNEQAAYTPPGYLGG